MFKPDKEPPPSRERMTLLALAILEEALAQKERGKIKRTRAHRLALSWIAYCGIGLEWHHKAFWKALADEHLNEANETYRRSNRVRDLIMLLDYWWVDIGYQPPCVVTRAEWAGKRPRTLHDRI